MSEQQRLNSIHFENLKCLKNITFDLGDKNVTGIFGPNGCGKSTILHVLLCLYKPKKERKNYKFSEFFISVDEEKWIGSKFSYSGSFSDRGVPKNFTRNVHKHTNRWLHDYGERPDRDVYFIGIETCVPDVEIEKDETVHLRPDGNEDIAEVNEILRVASDVMNFNYSLCNYRKSNKRSYINCTNNGIAYLSLSMGAGEQRLFKILTTVINAPRYSLIVIDEIDLTLHSRALDRLINHLVRIANNKHLQIVFTSHRQEIALRTDINIRHILPSSNGGNTICFDHSTSECIERLTGVAVRPIEIFVEDDVAKAVVEQIVYELKVKTKTSVRTFGDAANAFKVIDGLKLAGKLNENIIAVTDGDVYVTEDDRQKIVKKIISGTEVGKDEFRAEILEHVLQFNLPPNGNPDKNIHDILCESDEDNEIVNAAKAVMGVYDNHQYINELCLKLGGSREIELSHIIQEAAKNQDKWLEYTKPIRDWLEYRKKELRL